MTPRGIRPKLVEVYTARGYTVFAVVHGSMPKFTIPEAAADVHRGVRFIRANAKRFGIDKQRIAIVGGSAGGHLALLVATAGTPGRAGASDPVLRESSRVQVVAALFPPTDFLNWEKPGQTILQTLAGERFRAPFDFRTYDLKTNAYVPLSAKAVQRELRAISPITHVSGDDPPAMLIHGEKDPLVPVQQSELMFAALERAGCRARLIVKEGAGHGWRRFRPELEMTADWFDRYLR